MIVFMRLYKPPNIPPFQPPPIQPQPCFYNALKPPCKPPLVCFHHAFLIESMFSCHTIPGKRKRQKSRKTACKTLKTVLRVFSTMLLELSCIPLVWRLFHHGVKNVLVTLLMYPIFDRWSALTDGQSLTTGQFFLVNQFAHQGTLRPSRNRRNRNNAFCAFCDFLFCSKKMKGLLIYLLHCILCRSILRETYEGG